jgi:hypothetical protein
VLQARDTALLVAARGLHVARRAADGRWRLAVAVVDRWDDEEEDR